MDFVAAKNYCTSKLGAEETFPFDEETLVIKVGGKMFAMVGTAYGKNALTLKCNPGDAVILRAKYAGEIIPGYHMNKQHWNSIYFENSIPDEEMFSMIDQAHKLVFDSLTRKARKAVLEEQTW